MMNKLALTLCLTLPLAAFAAEDGGKKIPGPKTKAPQTEVRAPRNAASKPAVKASEAAAPAAAAASTAQEEQIHAQKRGMNMASCQQQVSTQQLDSVSRKQAMVKCLKGL